MKSQLLEVHPRWLQEQHVMELWIQQHLLADPTRTARSKWHQRVGFIVMVFATRIDQLDTGSFIKCLKLNELFNFFLISFKECFRESCQSKAAYNFTSEACFRPRNIASSPKNKSSKLVIGTRNDIPTYTEEEVDNEHFRCPKNSSFKIDCNTCWCRKDGKGPKYCTRIACKPKTYKPLPSRHWISKVFASREIKVV